MQFVFALVFIRVKARFLTHLMPYSVFFLNTQTLPPWQVESIAIFFPAARQIVPDVASQGFLLCCGSDHETRNVFLTCF